MHLNNILRKIEDYVTIETTNLYNTNNPTMYITPAIRPLIIIIIKRSQRKNDIPIQEGQLNLKKNNT